MKIAFVPSSASIFIRRLYFAVRSLRAGAPVLICPVPVATTKPRTRLCWCRWQRRFRLESADPRAEGSPDGLNTGELWSKSAMVVSSVSPERCDTIAVQEARWASWMAWIVSVSVPTWFSLIKMLLQGHCPRYPDNIRELSDPTRTGRRGRDSASTFASNGSDRRTPRSRVVGSPRRTDSRRAACSASRRSRWTPRRNLHRGLGEYRYRPRHRDLRCAVDSALVAAQGRPVYQDATTLLITADAGGSNGARLRLWKWELQPLANRTGLATRSVISRRARANGTKSGIGCSRTLP